MAWLELRPAMIRVNVLVAIATNQLCILCRRVGCSCGYKILLGSRLFALDYNFEAVLESLIRSEFSLKLSLPKGPFTTFIGPRSQQIFTCMDEWGQLSLQNLQQVSLLIS
ncbi:hypothetical protein PMIT1323_01573 [Prochlorococcus marinus str. MIT 1323]|nr:hypothetical protein PMIT1323_01573 [Prochlorococcus marinus str. MIT 1323]